MRIGADVDDVLFPWYDTAHRACTEAGITNGITPTSWTVHEDYGCTLEDWIGALSAWTLDGRLYQGDPYPGAVDALERLKAAGHSIHLVTARGLLQHGELIKAHTYRWVADHLAHVVDSLTFSKDKTVVPVDVFIDDNLKNYDALADAGIEVWLVEQPWNRDGLDTRWSYPSFAAFADDILHKAAVNA